jgi:2-dehydropantoate 2-reductase
MAAAAPRLRLCVYGAGAVGSNLAARLALAGHAVSVIARGRHLDAVRAAGMSLELHERLPALSGGGGAPAPLPRRAPLVLATDDPGALDAPLDAVFVTMKACGLGAAAEGLATILRRSPGAPVVFVQNGGACAASPPLVVLPRQLLLQPLHTAAACRSCCCCCCCCYCCR